MTWLLALTIAYSLSTALLTAAVIYLWRRPNARDIRIGQLESDHDDLRQRVQRLGSKIGRAKQLERIAEEESAEETAAVDTKQRPGESAIDYKRRMRLLMAEGKLKHHE